MTDITIMNRFGTCTRIIAIQAALYVAYIYIAFIALFNTTSFIYGFRKAMASSSWMHSFLSCNLNVEDIIVGFYLISMLIVKYITTVYSTMWWTQGFLLN